MGVGEALGNRSRADVTPAWHKAGRCTAVVRAGDVLGLCWWDGEGEEPHEGGGVG